MITLLLVAQLTITDSVYSTPSVRSLVTAASMANRTVPTELRSYRANVESEVSLILVPSEGSEAAGQVEQLENLVSWLRTGEYEQRVVGYRVRSSGLSLSTLSYVRSAWTIPVLYGNSLSLFFGSRDTTADPVGRRERRRPRDGAVVAIHPLSNSREQVYRFGGGDTVALIRLRNRSVAVRRVLVEPALEATWPRTVFRGEIDLDADRLHIVRMRGRFLTIGPGAPAGGRTRRGLITSVAYVELVNGEINEEFWLPAYQRIEAQVASVITGDARSAFRVVSRFRNYRLNEQPVLIDVGTPGDTLRALPHRLSIAPADSLQQYSGWVSAIGESGREARATDFDDIAPQRWKPTGAPRLELRVNGFSEVIRFNRVEGLYTGMGLALRFRDAFPGLAVRANAGYAWTEATVKGVVVSELKRGRGLVALSGARLLANTNDFRPAIDAGATIPALFATRDDYDYVDRRLALATARVMLGNIKTPPALLRFAVGRGSDHAERQRLTKGVFGERYSFLPNRNVGEGAYWLTSSEIDLHPEITGESITPGVGAAARYELAGGDIAWQRLEGRITARRNGGILTYAARLDGGMLLGGADIPPQQLFEVGGSTGLPGYRYKEFAGDRAALGRALVMASLPVFRSPLRISRRWFLPAPSPALSLGLQGGWTGVSSPRAVTAVAGLVEVRDRRTGMVRTDASGVAIPLSRPAYRIRTSVDLGLRFFGGAIMAGVARPLDHHGSWRFLISGSTWQ